jgi:hypothetical protein
MGTRKNFFENYCKFGHASSKRFTKHVLSIYDQKNGIFSNAIEWDLELILGHFLVV